MDEKSREAFNAFMKDNRIFGFNRPRSPLFPELREPNPPQKALLEAWMNPKYKVFTFTGGNRMGKTFIGSYLAISVMAGKWFFDQKKMVFPHDRPRKIRYVGQSWEGHVKAVIEPALKFWWPKSRPVETKKNNQGIEAYWKDNRTGSTIEIMSNVQDSSVFEGWEGDLIVYDEPPKRDVRIACARGLIDRGGRELFCMTLLKEAWIYHEVILATLEDNTPDLTVFNIEGKIFDNLGYGLEQQNIDQFAKTLNEKEKKARLYGQPSFMSSLVCPNFKRHTHIKERFKIPLDALIDIQIDFHPSKKWAVVFVATLKNGFKYVCDEIWDNGNPKYIAEEILRKIRERNYERINSIEIDPLAKGGEGNEIDVYSIMSDVFASRNLALQTASKDKDVGIALLNNLLWTENEMPGLFFFHDLHKTIKQIEGWMYDEDTLKPSKVDDDFVECLYRAMLKNTTWFDEFQFNTSKQKAVML